ncbi:MAG: ChrR family anti-sigma-E factor [Steroidobacteraceae bacterium]
MTPRHHLDLATLVGYSAGALPPAFAAVAATHIGLCPQCRAGLSDADRVGGLLLHQQPPAPVSENARLKLLARLQSEPDDGVQPQPQSVAAADLLPAPLRPYFGDSFSALRWRRVAPGVHHIRGPAMPHGELMLLRVAAGRSVPQHGHGGSELTVILSGAYDDVLGHFAAGDAADLDMDVQHQPVTSPGPPCICVAAVDAPLRFSGWFARMLRPLMGF